MYDPIRIGLAGISGGLLVLAAIGAGYFAAGKQFKSVKFAAVAFGVYLALSILHKLVFG